MNRMIPKPSEALLLGNGLINPIWWRYLQGLSGDQSVAGLQAQITELARRIAELGGSLSVLGTMSVKAVDQPDGSVVLSLDGDALHVGSNAFYSTDHAGRKRWAPLSQSIQGGGGIVFTDSGYTVMGAVDSDEDLPPTGNPGEAWWVGNILYAWNGVDGEWQPDYEPSGMLELGLIPGIEDGDTLVWRGSQWVPEPQAAGGVLPFVTGEIVNGQPVFVYADDGSLIYSEIA